jgi:hypothetical protein
MSYMSAIESQHTSVQRVAHPFQHLIVELQKSQKFGELLFQFLLAHIATATGSWIASAFIGVAGAVVIDVTLLLDFADDRAAALGASDQSREREISPALF